jgi:DNA-binding NtrC family response regulator
MTKTPGRTTFESTNGRDRRDLLAAGDHSVPVIAVRIHENGEAPLLLLLADVRGAALIGRFEQADVRLRSDRVSRVHGMLRKDGDAWSYLDLGSANGSFLTTTDEARQGATSGRRVVAGDVVPLAAVEAIVLGSRACWIETLTSLPPSPSTSTRSPAGRRFEEQLAQAAPSRRPVFLLGASGTGKTWAARQLHERGGFDGAFVVVNCARLPNDPIALRAQLLGHVKGAYTNADRAVTGAFFDAHGGTLFLDEVESLPPVAQGFLLDVIEGSGDYAPLGVAPHEAPKPPRFRLVSASKKPLRASTLRADLAWRLADGEIIAVPGLQARRQDIPGLVHTFLQAAQAARGGAGVVVADEAMELLVQAPWPGEVRALRAAVETVAEATVRAGRTVMSAADVRARLRAVDDAFGPDAGDLFGPDPTATELARGERTGRFRVHETVHDAAAVSAAIGSGIAAAVDDAVGVNPRHVDAATIRAALAATGGNIEHAAKRLRIARRTLMKKMDDFGLPRARRPDGDR